MNDDILKGQWKELVGSVRQQWGKLTDDELTEIDGNRERLVGKLQKHYGYTRENAERELDSYLQKQR